MLRRRIRTISILAALLALFVMTACVAADTGAQSGDMAADDTAADDMAEEGYPEEMIIGQWAPCRLRWWATRSHRCSRVSSPN